MAHINIDNIKVKHKGKEVKLIRKTEFAKVHGNGCSTQAIDYAIQKNYLDWTVLDGSKEKLILLTSKSLEYTPRQDAGENRSTMST